MQANQFFRLPERKGCCFIPPPTALHFGALGNLTRYILEGSRLKAIILPGLSRTNRVFRTARRPVTTGPCQGLFWGFWPRTASLPAGEHSAENQIACTPASIPAVASQSGNSIFLQVL
jgi:hypothetical protein